MRSVVENIKNEICREEYRMTFGQLAALLALVAGYRVYECPLTLEQVDGILQSQEGCRVNAYLNKLMKMGLVYPGSGVRAGVVVNAFGGDGHRGCRKTFIPSPAALTKFPEPERERVGVVKARVPRERPGVERRRRAG